MDNKNNDQGLLLTAVRDGEIALVRKLLEGEVTPYRKKVALELALDKVGNGYDSMDIVIVLLRAGAYTTSASVVGRFLERNRKCVDLRVELMRILLGKMGKSSIPGKLPGVERRNLLGNLMQVAVSHPEYIIDCLAGQTSLDLSAHRSSSYQIMRVIFECGGSPDCLFSPVFLLDRPSPGENPVYGQDILCLALRVSSGPPSSFPDFIHRHLISRLQESVQGKSEHFRSLVYSLKDFLVVLDWVGVNLKVYVLNLEIFLEKEMVEIRSFCQERMSNPRKLEQYCHTALRNNMAGPSLMWALSCSKLAKPVKDLILLENLTEVIRLENK